MANCCWPVIREPGRNRSFVSQNYGLPFKRILKLPNLLEVYLIVSLPRHAAKAGTRRELTDIVHYDEYDMSKYMQNSEIEPYLRSLRKKTRFRYEEIERVKTEALEARAGIAGASGQCQ